MIETIYIARHGYRANWDPTPNWASPTGLPRDPCLSAHGETQAGELANYIGKLPEDRQPTAIFSSPYYRCLQTSLPVAIKLDLPIYVEHGVAEWYSPVAPGTGLHPRPKQASELKSYVDQIDPSWTPTWMPSRKGETVQEIHDRVNGFLELFVQRLETSHHKNVLLVSHAATVIALARGLLAEPEKEIRVGCCSLSEFSRKEGGVGVLGAWDAVKLANVDHLLEKDMTRHWGFEDIVINPVNKEVVNDTGVLGTEGERDDNHGAQLSML
ncbi:hypothetical protein HYDPIDRAFT_173137 [Hydnomerulius pinastri MD-312]|nr:hypothetical protein HYDPIDRAFT_173137 [Hydnomerulius pinastri MD-312]